MSPRDHSKDGAPTTRGNILHFINVSNSFMHVGATLNSRPLLGGAIMFSWLRRAHPKIRSKHGKMACLTVLVAADWFLVWLHSHGSLGDVRTIGLHARQQVLRLFIQRVDSSVVRLAAGHAKLWPSFGVFGPPL